MPNIFVDVFIVNLVDMINSSGVYKSAQIMGLAEKKPLIQLPNGSPGIKYLNSFFEVFVCCKDKYITDLSNSKWQEAGAGIFDHLSSVDFNLAEKSIETLLNRYLNEESKVKKSETAFEISSKTIASKANEEIEKIPTPYCHQLKHLDDYLIDSFELTVRSINGLMANGITTIGDLVKLTEFQLSKLPNLGRKSIGEITDMLDKLGLKLGMSLNEISSKTITSKANEEIEKIPTSYCHQLKHLDEYLIDSFELTVRSTNGLMGNDITTIGDLVKLTEFQLFKLPNLGRTSIGEITDMLDKLGLKLGMSLNEISSKTIASKANEEIEKIPTPNCHQLKHLDDYLIDSFELTVRSTNGLMGNDITTIGDLVKLTEFQLSKLPNLGRKSIGEITDMLDKLGLKLGMSVNEITTTTLKNLETEGQDENSSLPENEKSSSEIKSVDQKLSYFGDRDTLEAWILAFLPKQKTELIERIIGNSTLEETGQKMGVTRERVRQLQAKYQRTFRKKWDFHISKINDLELPISEPCHLFMLPLYSKYFEGISKYIPSSKSFFADLFQDDDSKYRIEEICGDMLIVRRNFPEYSEIVSTIFQLSIENDYRDYLKAVNRLDLKDYLPSLLREREPKSQAGKIKKYLRIIFDQNDCLFSNNELRELLADKYGIMAHTNEVSYQIKSLGDVYLFGSRGWGSEKKFIKFGITEIASIQKCALSILEDAKQNQIHVETILRSIKLSNLDVAVGERLDKYHLNWILHKEAENNPTLIDLGRFMWSLGKTDSRQPIVALVIALLYKNGKPMTNLEVKDEIKKIRGVGTTFQIRPSKSYPDLVHLENGLWGLRNRDLAHISEEMEAAVISNIHKYFESGIQIIDSQLLTKIIEDSGLNEFASFFEVSRLLLRYTSTTRQELSTPLRVYLSSDDVNAILVVDPKFKGNVPKI